MRENELPINQRDIVVNRQPKGELPPGFSYVPEEDPIIGSIGGIPIRKKAYEAVRTAFNIANIVPATVAYGVAQAGDLGKGIDAAGRELFGFEPSPRNAIETATMDDLRNILNVTKEGATPNREYAVRMGWMSPETAAGKGGTAFDIITGMGASALGNKALSAAFRKIYNIPMAKENAIARANKMMEPSDILYEGGPKWSWKNSSINPKNWQFTKEAGKKRLDDIADQWIDERKKITDIVSKHQEVNPPATTWAEQAAPAKSYAQGLVSGGGQASTNVGAPLVQVADELASSTNPVNINTVLREGTTAGRKAFKGATEHEKDVSAFWKHYGGKLKQTSREMADEAIPGGGSQLEEVQRRLAPLLETADETERAAIRAGATPAFKPDWRDVVGGFLSDPATALKIKSLTGVLRSPALYQTVGRVGRGVTGTMGSAPGLGVLGLGQYEFGKKYNLLPPGFEFVKE